MSKELTQHLVDYYADLSVAQEFAAEIIAKEMRKTQSPRLQWEYRQAMRAAGEAASKAYSLLYPK